MELKQYLTGEIDTSKQIMTGDASNEALNNGTMGNNMTSSRSVGGSARNGGFGASMSSEAQSNELLMAAERSLKRKRELIEGSGMMEDEALQCAVKARNQETTQSNRNSILDVVQGDFSEVLESHQAVSLKSNKKSKAEEAKKLTRDSKWPIILVSESTSQAKISMWNALSLLGDDRRYVSIKDAKKAASGRGSGGVRKEPKQVLLVRNNVTYRILPIGITSKSQYWSKNDFSRVVGLFADGSTWCYKKFPGKTPVNVFNSVVGFHLYYADEKPQPNCQKWIVDKIAIDKNKRHHDAVAVQKIWRRIDTFISHKKPEYLPENWKNPRSK